MISRSVFDYRQDKMPWNFTIQATSVFAFSLSLTGRYDIYLSLKSIYIYVYIYKIDAFYFQERMNDMAIIEMVSKSAPVNNIYFSQDAFLWLVIVDKRIMFIFQHLT